MIVISQEKLRGRSVSKHSFSGKTLALLETYLKMGRIHRLSLAEIVAIVTLKKQSKNLGGRLFYLKFVLRRLMISGVD